jgi:hypothetical protein
VRIERRFVGLIGAVALSVSLIACAPSLYDFHDRILEPLAAQKADEVAEQNRLHVRKAFEKAKESPYERWFQFFYWSLDALGVAGYGMPAQGRLLEKLQQYYRRSSNKSREAILQAVLLQIDEERATDKQLILNNLIDRTSQEFAFFGRIYSVCVDGVARRYRASGDTFRRLEDQPC